LWAFSKGKTKNKEERSCWKYTGPKGKSVSSRVARLGISWGPGVEKCNEQTAKEKRERSQGKLGEGQWQGVTENQNRTRRK